MCKTNGAQFNPREVRVSILVTTQYCDLEIKEKSGIQLVASKPRLHMRQSADIMI